jgi:hypothetical protein
MPSQTLFLSQSLHDKLKGEHIPIDHMPKTDVPLYFNFNGTQMKSPFQNQKAPFLVHLFHTLASVKTRPPLE